MTRIIVKNTIKLFLFIQVLFGGVYFYSFEWFINIQIAFLSAYFIIIGSSIAYSKMIKSQVANEERDLLDEIEDPHELYDDKINEAPIEELDFKQIVKEEKAKIKTLSLKNMKHGTRGSISLFRLVPYLFLVLGFIALKNNELLNLSFYLPALLLGVITGSLSTKNIVATS